MYLCGRFQLRFGPDIKLFVAGLKITYLHEPTNQTVNCVILVFSYWRVRTERHLLSHSPTHMHILVSSSSRAREHTESAGKRKSTRTSSNLSAGRTRSANRGEEAQQPNGAVGAQTETTETETGTEKTTGMGDATVVDLAAPISSNSEVDDLARNGGFSV